MPTRKRVLIVGMLDSIHLAKWLQRFDSSLVEFTLFPSKKYKLLHPEIVKYCKSNSNVKIAHQIFLLPKVSYGYMDYFIHEVVGRYVRALSRTSSLKRLLSNDFEYLHAHELQGAGYLCSNVQAYTKAEFILSIWGSDLIYFSQLPDHNSRILAALTTANTLSAECVRDYRLAISLGFRGLELPAIPVSASFSEVVLDLPPMPVNDRTLIIVKTYGAPFGRGDLAIKAIFEFLQENPEPDVLLYSVGEDLIEQAKLLKATFPHRVEFRTLKNSIPQNELYEYFKRSRLYLGVSESDGISTSFLEAIALGAYPIQTNTSCGDEWAAIGVMCSLIEVNLSSILEALSENYFAIPKLQSAQMINLQIAKQNLEYGQISKKAQAFYFRD